MTPIRFNVSKPRGCQSLVVWDRGDHVELSLLVVRPECRRRGIGSRAMERLKSSARSVGKAISLTVDRPRRAGLTRFYQQLGFQETGGLGMAWRPEVAA